MVLLLLLLLLLLMMLFLLLLLLLLLLPLAAFCSIFVRMALPVPKQALPLLVVRRPCAPARCARGRRARRLLAVALLLLHLP